MRYVLDPRCQRPQRWSDRYWWVVPILLILSTLVGPR